MLTGALWRIFFCFALGYFLSYALRSVNAAIAPGLVADLSLNSEQLGKLTSAYLLAFASLQIPLGIWLDRYGARKTESALLLVAALGCLVFAMSSSYWALWVGRALIGAGVCGCLMGAYKGFRDWFPANMQSRLAAWMLVAGTSGVLVTTVPVQWMVSHVGWRPAFYLAATLLVVSSAALWFGLPRENTQKTTLTPFNDEPENNSKKTTLTPLNEKTTLTPLLKVYGFGDVARELYFWRMAFIGVIFVGGFIALQSLWIGPWMTTVLGFSPKVAAQNLFVFNSVLMLSYFALGSVSPRLERLGISITTVAVGCNIVGLVVLAAIAYWNTPTSWWLWLVFAVSTVANTVIQPHLSLQFPQSLNGRANALFNLLIFAGAFFLQWGFGAVIEWFKRGGANTVEAYQNTLWVYIAMALLSLMVFIVWRPKPPQFETLNS